MFSLHTAVEILFSQFIYIPSMFLLNFITYMQPRPYMDEVFHVNQTKAYLAGNWSHWDPMITTPPGLYFFGYLIAKPMHHFFPDLSVTYLLRHTNLILTPFIYFTLSHIVNELTPKNDISPLKASFSAFNCLCLPLVYFFNGFYYTDHASLLFTLLSLKLTLHQSKFAIFAYILAFLTRQTCIIWINFAFGILFVREVQITRQVSFHFYNYLVALWRILSDPSQLFRTLMRSCVANHFQVVIMNCIFLLYFYSNDFSIVLGDKSMHRPSFHAMQILYFVSFCAFFTPLSFCKFCIDFFAKLLPLAFKRLHFFLGSLVLLIFILSVIVISIQYFSVEHVYLLSDNRHYTHILWRKFINPNRFKIIPFYFLAVLYYFDSMLTLRNKFSFQHASTVLGHFICICLTLIPSPLLEMRYFIIPFITWRLLSYKSSQYDWRSIIVDFIWYLFINALTFYAFAWKTFEWPEQPGVSQRFMW